MNGRSVTSGIESFLESLEGTREEIIRATYLALCNHGYGDLTVQRIGEEFPKSKSLLYHHYDGKDDLLSDFLSFLVDQFEAAVPFEDASGPGELLEVILEFVFATPLAEHRLDLTRAIVEHAGSGIHDEAYRVHFTRHDRFLSPIGVPRGRLNGRPLVSPRGFAGGP